MMDHRAALIGQPQPAPPIFLKDTETGETFGYPQVATVLVSDTIFANLVSTITMSVAGRVINELEKRGIIPLAPEGEDAGKA